MKLLLDTHAFIWAMGMVSNLPTTIASAISDPDNEVWISVVSAYEIDYKRDRDRGLASLPADLISAAAALPARWLAVEPEHAVAAARLPREFRDPWDRIIAAQAMVKGLTLLSRDPAMRRMGAPVLW